MLPGRVIAVTGAGRVTGRETALLAARRRALAVVSDRGGSLGGKINDSGPASDGVEEIRGFCGEAIAAGANTCGQAGARAIIEKGVAVFGGIEGAVNYPGTLRKRLFHKLPPRPAPQSGSGLKP